MPPNQGHASQNDSESCRCDCHVVHRIDDPSTLSPESLRWELDHHTHVLQKLREQCALVDAERLKLATQLSKHPNQPHERKPHERQPHERLEPSAALGMDGGDEPQEEEIIAMVEDINTQVFNIGRKVAKDIVEEFPQNSSKDRDWEANVDAGKELWDAVGAKMVNILLKANFTKNSTPVQLAIQTMLINGIYSMLLSWPILTTRQFSQDFWTLYKCIQKKEVQPIAARWRALGSKHYRQSGLVDIHACALDGILTEISKILRISGVCTPTSKDDKRLDNFVRTCVGQNVNAMWQTADAFAQKIQERVHSTDYQLLFVVTGDAFDSNGMRRQGALLPPTTGKSGENGKKDKEDNIWRVLCTTELGLQRTTNRGKLGDSNPELHKEVIKKPAVMLEHVPNHPVDDSSVPPQSRQLPVKLHERVPSASQQSESRAQLEAAKALYKAEKDRFRKEKEEHRRSRREFAERLAEGSRAAKSNEIREETVARIPLSSGSSPRAGPGASKRGPLRQ